MKGMFVWIGWGLLAFLVVVAVVYGIGLWTFNRQVDQEVEALLAAPPAADASVIAPEILVDLPQPVQRYLSYSGIAGQPAVHTVRLKQTGRFRTGVDRPWMDFHAEQYYTVDQPGFLWNATFTQSGMPFLRVRDYYVNGKGDILGKLAGLFTIADSQGEALNQGAMLRYLNEMVMWFPQALLNENITFIPVDEGSAQVTFTDQGKSVTATLFVDAEGKLTDFVAERYFEAGDASYPWRTPISGYGEVNGLRLPNSGQGIWKLPEGDFAYIDLVIPELEYNARAPFGAE